MNQPLPKSAFDAPTPDIVPAAPESKRRLLAGLVVALVLLVTALGATMAWRALQQRNDAAEALLPPPTPPPAIEPLEVKQIAPEAAREINATVPFTKDPVPAAKPFHITGEGVAVERAVDCMASAIFYEAGAETVDGQKAVAQVIINRVRHPAYPNSVCGVVYQGSTRTTGCQFSFTCDGSMRRVPSASYWTNLRKLARSMLTGTVYKPVGLATHYHTDWVVPVWSAKLDKIRAEGTHLFFRWTGWWGTPPAFRSGWAGSEPQVSKLATLSPGHAQTLAGEVAIDAGAPPIDMTGLIPAVAGKPVYANAAGDFLIFLIDRRSDPGGLPGQALAACGNGPYCKVMMWTDPAVVPRKLPIEDAQLSKLAFSFLRNTSSGYEKALWNCDLFKRPDPAQCMKPRVALSGGGGGSAAIVDRTAQIAPGAPVAGRPRDNTANLLPADPDDTPEPTVKVPPVPAPDRNAERRRPGG